MTNTTRATIHSIEHAATARWLAQALAADRERVQKAPTDEEVDRIRLRVVGRHAVRRRVRIAA